jgi:transposase
LVAADARTPLTFSISPGQASDDAEGRKLIPIFGLHRPTGVLNVLMDRAYEGDAMQEIVRNFGMEPVVPPKKNRLVPWEYDRELYKKRNEVERLFRRLKGFRRVFSRFEKLDIMFVGFVQFALVVDMLRLC